MTEIELAPCPFCGGEASCSPADDSGEVVFAVACMSCLAQITKCDEMGAIRQWNDRTPEAADKLEALSGRISMLTQALRTAHRVLEHKGIKSTQIDAALAQTQSEG